MTKSLPASEAELTGFQAAVNAAFFCSAGSALYAAPQVRGSSQVKAVALAWSQ